MQSILDRILALSDEEVAVLLSETRNEFKDRHGDLEEVWARNATAALDAAETQAEVTDERRALLGAYFTSEYALEAAAVTNPSMVAAPEGGARFVMSLRAIGEGHISSVEFRTGSFEDGEVRLDPVADRLSPGERRSPTYARHDFFSRLAELGPDPQLAQRIFDNLGEEFTLSDLDAAISIVKSEGASEATIFETRRLIHWVATSNYEVAFVEGPLSSRVLVPAGPADSQGIEDVRLVRFVDEDGTITYCGTYTAFDGYTILPQLIETRDFRRFRISTMSGSCARNKGMAIFPRRIEGSYVALGRVDRESIFVMRSDRLRAWDEAERVYPPSAGWELVQVGNCGPPIETERGWLVLTHGVGPMRRYSIGAMLLDLDHPERLVARLEEPLLEPGPSDRDGYVPNVVYSCGGMVHEGTLVVPYGFSDRGVAVGTIPLDDLLDALTPL